MTDSMDPDVGFLERQGMVGFCGAVPSGLKVHPNGKHIIYAVGSILVVQEIGNKDSTQEFLSKHTNNVTCIAVSKSGRFVASGQTTHQGFKADIIVWDFASRKPYAQLSLHKVKVEALAFSPNDKYLVSLGGEDDGSVVVWNLCKNINGQPGDAICGSPAQVQSAGMTHTVAYSNTRDDCFVTGGTGSLRVWKLDVENRKIRPTDVTMGQVRRVIKCIELAANDDFMYCGTTSGDILGINMSSYNFQFSSTDKERFCNGLTSLTLLKSNGNEKSEILVGAGDGTVAVVGINLKEKKFKRLPKKVKVKGAVTSIAIRGAGHQFYVGTTNSEIYRFSYSEFTHELLTTCHPSPINDIAFPHNTELLYATAGKGDVRVWDADKNQELLRITEPELTCNAIDIAKDGKSIITGWHDGIIRAYSPRTGKLVFKIENAHEGGVTALAMYTDCQHIVSGGNKGVVRVWEVSDTYCNNGKSRIVTKLAFGLEEHLAQVTCIKVKEGNAECVTSSTDGTCIIWDLQKRNRKHMIRVNTLFKHVCYHPNPGVTEILTTGTDRKVGYFNSSEGLLLRELDGSRSGSINAVDISNCGRYFVTGGDDTIVKVWSYIDGQEKFVGRGHSASITRVKISSEINYILSASADGAIIKWRFPAELKCS